MDLSSIGSSISSGLSSLASLGAMLGGASASRVLKLGDFVFQELELPEMIALGGAQQSVVHKMIGGARVVDQLGDDSRDYSFRGLFLGANAWSRAVALSMMRKKGGQVVLTFADMRYTVAVREVTFDYLAFNRIGYEIVLIDIPQIGGASVSVDANASILGSMSQATSLGSAIGDAGVNGSLSSLQSAISTVTDFASATKAQINSVMAPLANAQGAVSNFTASLNNDIRNITTLGGIAPNNPIAKSASGMLSTVNKLNQLSSSYALTNTLNNLGKTVSSVGSMGNTARTVTVVGGDLMTLAQQHYGDATQWTRIANANNLTDPKLAGTQTLIIPK